MKMLHAGEFSPTATSTVFRQSSISPLVMLVVFVSIVTGLSIAIVAGGWHWAAWLLVGFFALLGKFALSVLLASLKPSNWTMSVCENGCVIKFRSYLNHHFPDDDPTIFMLNRSEILSVRKHTQLRSRPSSQLSDSSDVEMRWQQISLDMTLTPGLATEIETALAGERQLKAPKRGISSTKAMHYFVSVPESDTLRVVWKSKSDRLTPSIDIALEKVGSLTQLEEPTSEDRRWNEMSDEQLDQYVMEMCETGDIFGATSILKRRYGYSTTEAQNFIDDLIGKAA